jgi:UDP-glucose 4-epimerase
LLQDEHHVVVVDDFSTGCPANLASHRGNPRLRVIQEDVGNLRAIQTYFEGVDWVFHLAAWADIVPSIERPLDYHRVNVDGTAGTLEASRAGGVRRFVYAASSSCYGIPDAYPTPETAPIRPEYPYALTKWLAEEMVLH